MPNYICVYFSVRMDSFPKNYTDGDYFLYIYQYKKGHHIRVATCIREIEMHFWCSTRRRAYNKDECAALGLGIDFLKDYYTATSTYFTARMVVGQNKPVRLSEFEYELAAPFMENMECARLGRLKAGNVLKHRAWSNLALLRKRARAVLPTTIPALSFTNIMALYK